VITFSRLKRASFTHSAIYLTLLVSWAVGADGLKYVCGWAHGLCLWISIPLLTTSILLELPAR